MTGDSFGLEESQALPVRDRIEWALRQAVQALHAVGEAAEVDRRHAISFLRQDAAGAAAAAERVVRQSETDPMLRWSVVNVIGELEGNEVVGFLAGQALRNLGTRDPEGGCEQPIDAEVLVAVMAVEGLQGLAARGSREAVEALIQVVQAQPERPVREAAARGALAAQPELRARLEELLGRDRHVLDLRAANANDLAADPDLENPDGKQDRRFAGPKPLDRSRAAARERPIVDRCRDREGRD